MPAQADEQLISGLLDELTLEGAGDRGPSA
jgi:hypothetical protein